MDFHRTKDSSLIAQKGLKDPVKVIAFYLPQYHAIPENDRWWGKGFTDWSNVRKVKPLFDGHNQPRVPANSNYYDLSEQRTIEWQVELARSYGIYGFCHYHYWFDSVQLLEKPTNIFQQSKHLKLKYCLCWANETWSRRWDGQHHHVLQLQTHKPCKTLWGKHFDYLMQFWSDERAIQVNGKPLFIIYRPENIVELENMFDYWQTRAIDSGFNGIYFAAVQQVRFSNPDFLKQFDAVIHFQPFVAIYHSLLNKLGPFANGMNVLPKRLLNLLWFIANKIRSNYKGLTVCDYDKIWEQILHDCNIPTEMTTFPSAFVDWDNTARYGRKATLFKNANPERFEYWFRKLVDLVRMDQTQEPFIFVNAWNEWAEGTYLEPDEKFGFRYLESISRIVKE